MRLSKINKQVQGGGTFKDKKQNIKTRNSIDGAKQLLETTKDYINQKIHLQKLAGA